MPDPAVALSLRTDGAGPEARARVMRNVVAIAVRPTFTPADLATVKLVPTTPRPKPGREHVVRRAEPTRGQNKPVPHDHRVRVALGDPAFDFRTLRNGHVIEAAGARRDRVFAATGEREACGGRHVLLLSGPIHLARLSRNAYSGDNIDVHRRQIAGSMAIERRATASWVSIRGAVERRRISPRAPDLVPLYLTGSLVRWLGQVVQGISARRVVPAPGGLMTNHSFARCSAATGGRQAGRWRRLRTTRSVTHAAAAAT